MTEQQRKALERANEIRLTRAELKKALSEIDPVAARCHVADLLECPPEWLVTMRVFDLVAACNRMGVLKTRRLLASAGAGREQLVGDGARQDWDGKPRSKREQGRHLFVSERQRAALCEGLRATSRGLVAA